MTFAEMVDGSKFNVLAPTMNGKNVSTVAMVIKTQRYWVCLRYDTSPNYYST